MKKKTFLFLTVGILAIIVASLFLFSPKSVSVAKILESPASFSGKVVWVKGVVKKPVFVGNIGGYHLFDKNSSIVVAVYGIPPLENSEVKLEATVEYGPELGWHLQSVAQEIIG